MFDIKKNLFEKVLLLARPNAFFSLIIICKLVFFLLHCDKLLCTQIQKETGNKPTGTYPWNHNYYTTVQSRVSLSTTNLLMCLCVCVCAVHYTTRQP